MPGGGKKVEDWYEDGQYYLNRTKAIQQAYEFKPTDTPAQIDEKKKALLAAGAAFKAEHGDKSPHTLAGASPMHRAAVQILNGMGGEFKVDMYEFLLEMYGVDEPEIMYNVINTVLRCHDNNSS